MVYDIQVQQEVLLWIHRVEVVLIAVLLRLYVVVGGKQADVANILRQERLQERPCILLFDLKYLQQFADYFFVLQFEQITLQISHHEHGEGPFLSQ